MEPHRTLVFEYNEMPPDIKRMLQHYYHSTDQRGIQNDSYTRYPYLFDWEWDENYTMLDRWFFLGGASWNMGYIIIHWEW